MDLLTDFETCQEWHQDCLSMDAESFGYQIDEKFFPGAVDRSKLIQNMITPEWVAHLLGISLNGKTGEEAKDMLRLKKVKRIGICQRTQI